MRQACSHPSLITGSARDDKEGVEAPAAIVTRPSSPTKASSSAKKDSSADDDLDALIGGLGSLAVDNAGPRICALCPEPSRGKDEGYCADCHEELGRYSRLTFSTKIRRMMKCLDDIRRESPEKKTIVFSQVRRCSVGARDAGADVPRVAVH